MPASTAVAVAPEVSAAIQRAEVPEGYTNEQDVFCPRFPDLNTHVEIAQWYDPTSCQKCCSEAKRGKCAREKRKNCG